ncbi:hypothetical protein ACFQH2_02475 [Natronoarchaeum sp. GCM10025703]|uniref:HVO_0234 family beta-propeller protein n=1 Tax=Natronoarchaeum sp. GCM10025703 TaxID=3252685 RepID=UPI003608E616
MGVVVASISGSRVGEFGLEYRTTVRDIAGAPGRIAVATDEDATLLGEEVAHLGFGPATAVGFDGEGIVAGDSEGRIARIDSAGREEVGTAGVQSPQATARSSGRRSACIDWATEDSTRPDSTTSATWTRTERHSPPRAKGSTDWATAGWN